MSDVGGLGGALLLSQQFEMYRWEDHFDRQRRSNDLAVDNAILRQQANQLVARYHQLVFDYNELLRRAMAVAKDSDHKTDAIRRLENTVRSLEAANAQLRLQAERDQAQIAYNELVINDMRKRERERDPDAFPFQLD